MDVFQKTGKYMQIHEKTGKYTEALRNALIVKYSVLFLCTECCVVFTALHFGDVQLVVNATDTDCIAQVFNQHGTVDCRVWKRR